MASVVPHMQAMLLTASKPNRMLAHAIRCVAVQASVGIGELGGVGQPQQQAVGSGHRGGAHYMLNSTMFCASLTDSGYPTVILSLNELEFAVSAGLSQAAGHDSPDAKG